MNEQHPFYGLDRVTFEIVTKLSSELAETLAGLACRDPDLALVQIDTLRKGAVDRLKSWDFEMLDLMLPQDQAVKVIAVSLAAIENAFANARALIVDRDEAPYRTGGEDKTPE